MVQSIDKFDLREPIFIVRNHLYLIKSEQVKIGLENQNINFNLCRCRLTVFEFILLDNLSQLKIK